MKIQNVSGTAEEAAKILSTMSSEQWHDLCDELFKYEPTRPYHLGFPDAEQRTEVAPKR